MGEMEYFIRNNNMGIETQTLKLLLASKKKFKINFDKCLTLGRQNVFLSEAEIKNIFIEYGEYYKIEIENLYTRYKFSENVFQWLGVNQLTTLDASEFEGANLIHDLNFPILEEKYNSYDCVCDFGTLEHIFNIPVAIKNCMNMVSVGGHFVAMTPCNNQFGHGFYQFSPEFFYSLFTPKYGFVVEDVILVEFGPFYKWYRVLDSNKIEMRTVMSNKYVSNLFVVAKKIKHENLEKIFPNQSDFISQWQNEASPAQTGYIDCFSNSNFDYVKTILLKFPKLARSLEAIRFSSWNRKLSLLNTKCFQRINDKIKLL